jgi:CheY-like chemotaxis protein
MAKILIVDDEKDIQELYQKVLQDAGFEVDTADSGKECLKKLRENSADLVLMDMFMPGLSGRETFEHILNDEKLKNIKVAFLTVADLGEKGRAELEYLGVSAYLNKPIENEELVKKVKEILGLDRVVSE